MLLKMKIKDRMIPTENYPTVSPNATLKEAALSLRTSSEIFLDNSQYYLRISTEDRLVLTSLPTFLGGNIFSSMDLSPIHRAIKLRWAS